MNLYSMYLYITDYIIKLFLLRHFGCRLAISIFRLCSPVEKASSLLFQHLLQGWSNGIQVFTGMKAQCGELACHIHRQVGIA